MKFKTIIMFAIISFFVSSTFSFAGQTRVYVKVKPPAPKKVVVVKKKPHENTFWVKGHWHWNGTKYVWIKGHWKQSQKGFVWVPGHWKDSKLGWFWVAGHWKKRT